MLVAVRIILRAQAIKSKYTFAAPLLLNSTTRVCLASRLTGSVTMCGAPGQPAAIIERKLCGQRLRTGSRGDAHASPRLDAR
jgi:hypothetical protein